MSFSDINEMEGCICELEKKIKHLKNYIETQLSSLKFEEKELIDDVIIYKIDIQI